MTKRNSARRRKLESLLQFLRRQHDTNQIRHYLCAEYPRTLRIAAIMVLRERSAT